MAGLARNSRPEAGGIPPPLSQPGHTCGGRGLPRLPRPMATALVRLGWQVVDQVRCRQTIDW